jgi:hypothetical protein
MTGGQVSGPLTPASIRALQRSAGNAAVGRVAQQLLQRDPKTKRRPKAAPAGADKKLRGGMLAAVTRRLGPRPRSTSSRSRC